MISRCKPASDYIVVITGDVVDQAVESSHLEAAQSMLKRLRANLGHVLIVVTVAKFAKKIQGHLFQINYAVSE